MSTEVKGRFGFGSFILFVLTVLGIVLALYRFATGIGSVANLNQGYPWGFWIGFDILAGIALAGGGFVIAAVVHIFGSEKYHALVRPAILTAFLGYLMFITGLLVDIGRPWMIWSMMINWQHESPMFEVGWCVMLYTTVLLFEFLPVVFEKYKMAGALKIWMNIMPLVAIVMLVFFAWLLSRSTQWTVVIAAVLVIFELAIRGGVLKRDPRVPTLLIMAGIIFSTLHQSSLGSLFLMVPHKLSMIWFSPILPVLFFISAVMAGMAMLIVESTLSSKFFRRGLELNILQGIGKGLSWVILIYLAVRVVDLAYRRVGSELLATSPQAVAFWIEIVIGLLIPLALLLTPQGVASGRGLFWAAIFVVVGLVVNRINVAVTGISGGSYPTYYPHWMEVAISVGIVSLGILAFLLICRNFPIFEKEHSHAASA